MQVGIAFEGRSTTRYLGDSRYYADKPFFEANVGLSPEVERAIELTEPIWSQSGDMPIFMLDRGDHGHDMGLVLRRGIQERVDDPDFVRSELVARISIGGTKDQKDARKLDFSQARRLHISVYGGRQFFPENWRNIPLEEIQRESHFDKVREYRSVTPYREEALISLRWIEGRYDSWDNLRDWMEAVKSTAITKKTFYESRATHCTSQGMKLTPRHTIAWLDKELAARFVRQEGRKKQKIPLSPGLSSLFETPGYQFMQKAMRDLFPEGTSARLPIIGYEGVSTTLSLPRPPKKFEEMSPTEGVEFLFKEVLPQIKEFVNSED